MRAGAVNTWFCCGLVKSVISTRTIKIDICLQANVYFFAFHGVFWAVLRRIAKNEHFYHQTFRFPIFSTSF